MRPRALLRLPGIVAGRYGKPTPTEYRRPRRPVIAVDRQRSLRVPIVIKVGMRRPTLEPESSTAGKPRRLHRKELHAHATRLSALIEWLEGPRPARAFENPLPD